MKKIVSTLLVAAMLLSSFMALGAFADNTTIEAINSSNVSQGYYSTIDAAANAAGVNGTVRLSAGTFEFNGRQTIAVEGVTLEGAGKDQTFIKTSSSFASGSATNKKALLTIAADYVTVQDLTIDGSDYGNTVSSDTDFVVLRCNSGEDVWLTNVLVKGSKKTLVQVGTSNTETDITAINFDCEAYYKQIPSKIGSNYSNVYPDIDITSNGTFNLTSGNVNAFISTDNENNLTYPSSGYYRITRSFLFVKYVDVTTTARHFLYSYNYVKNDSTVSSSDKATFRATVRENASVINAMTNEVAVAGGDQEMIGIFIEMLTDVLSDGYNETLSNCRTRLQQVYTGGNS